MVAYGSRVALRMSEFMYSIKLLLLSDVYFKIYSLSVGLPDDLCNPDLSMLFKCFS
jgi:hypothetical protein